jgi:acyl transferase domain-containing protein/surfactin synthase thioesterase subunit
MSVSSSQRPNQDPIAIVGIGCRFPKANDPQSFWHLLKNKIDIIQEKPAARRALELDYASEAIVPEAARWGGFLDAQLTDFDPQFFKISPREASLMDPQQRLLLETAWEALEDAREIPDRLAGSQTGVFIGLTSRDYAHAEPMRGTIDPHVVTGVSGSIAANRISFVFDFIGPSLVVDTACSSSLVAVHLACQSLWQGESTLALAGGAQLMLSSWISNRLAAAGFLAADGRCKTFDSRANGYVRGEGIGIIALKPLAQAQIDGNPIYALIRGSAINQDGRSNGLTAPNPWSQKALLKAAYRQAKVSPSQVQYVEAHGTGTQLGDHIEMKTLGEVLSEDRATGNDCLVGSIKTNIGHTEAVAGLAGLIKVALSLHHRQIPPSLNLQTPNPFIRLEQLPLKLVSDLTSWPQNSHPAIAGVSSFGFGGTNAHVVLEAAPANPVLGSGEELSKKVREIDRCVPHAFQVLTLSAKTEPALQAMAQQYVDFLQTHPSTSIADICFSANTVRSQFNYRLATVAQSREQLQAQLQTFASGKESPNLISQQIGPQKASPKIAFLFTGQGAQYANMGRQLYDSEPRFLESIDRCAKLLEGVLPVPLLEVLYPKANHAQSVLEPKQSAKIHETAYAQPALFAVEYALAQLWLSWGIQPEMLMGHSLGEYVAACLAGVFSLEDALKLVATRGQLMQALPENGTMTSVLATVEQVEAVIDSVGEEITIAGFNGTENTVVSGSHSAILALCQQLEAQGIKFKSLQVSHAFHSPLMTPMLEAFEQVAQNIQYHLPQKPIVSTVTGKSVSNEIATPDYWCEQIINPVQFVNGMTTLQEKGCEIFVELGPKPVLIGMGQRCLSNGTWLPSLRQAQDDWQCLLNSLGTLAVQGISIDWRQVDPTYLPQVIRLPTYPFQRQRYWMPLKSDSSTVGKAANNGHSMNPKSPNSISLTNTAQTPILENLCQGDLQPLIEQVAADFSPEAAKFLPDMLNALVKLHQRQSKAIELEKTLTPFGAKSASESASTDRPNEPNISWNSLYKVSTSLQERQQLLKDEVSKILSIVLGMPPEHLDWQQQLVHFGFDSLMATELRQRLETKFDLNVPVEFFAQLNLEQVVEQIRLQIEKSIEGNENGSLQTEITARLWLNTADNNQARLRLFCFPHAGGGASFFQTWTKQFPANIELCPIQLPGREDRHAESPLTQIKEVIQSLLPVIRPLVDSPFAIFGHSMGALLAFELARELRRQGLPLPKHLLVSGYRAPQLPDMTLPIHRFPKPKFLEAVQAFQGMPQAILRSPERLEPYLPQLRADFRLLETYIYTNEAPLDCPITAFGGNSDPIVSREALNQWHGQTSGAFKLQTFPGDHFFLQSDSQPLIEEIIAQLFPKPLLVSL